MKNWRDRETLRLDTLLADIERWVLEQFDQETGGFYFSRSAMIVKAYPPDIESTAQALNILLRCNRLEVLPKEKLIAFFQAKQDPESGYFYDEHPLMKQDEVMVHRALNYAVNSLKRLGAKPLYPLPIEQQQAPAYTNSLETYRKKWASISLSNSWRGCDLLASSTIYFAEMETEKRQAYVKAFASFLEEKQDKETGLWGEGSLYVRISGTFKLHTFYRKHQLAMPRQQQIYQSIWECLHTEEAVDMCYIRNPIDLLAYLAVDISDQALEKISRLTIDHLSRLKQQDGVFSRELGHSVKAPNVAQVKEGEYYPDMPAAVELGLGLPEGDMNATTQATLIRKQLHQLWQQ
ncbi:prenyltransferase/squalene oxidase repeat-containing protein [Gracilibacillus alcaliphilus]|uniref:hypothetical protein n=1 Tax=Gracilibacillus alcaliphilus TaxID=1401441 RepID=UPI001EF7A206|nr:hypothetical protein [Gracilibacillus alcaliphilus]MBM7679184.1 hypothetical protein [Gracilibacillus alcaliphilus]